MLQQTVLAQKVRVDAPLPVTAVVPTHRRPELMRQAVQSISDQDYLGMIEVIVVSGACDPHLPDVVRWPTRMLHVVADDRARGPAGARGTGILATSHEFVAFLDDDNARKAGIANLLGRGI